MIRRGRRRGAAFAVALLVAAGLVGAWLALGTAHGEATPERQVATIGQPLHTLLSGRVPALPGAAKPAIGPQPALPAAEQLAVGASLVLVVGLAVTALRTRAAPCPCLARGPPMRRAR